MRATVWRRKNVPAVPMLPLMDGKSPDAIPTKASAVAALTGPGSSMRAAVIDGTVNAVIVHKLDRLARNLRLMLEIIDECGKHKAAFVSVSEQIDISTPMGWAMFQVQGVFA